MAYEVKPLNAPPLAGAALRVLTVLAETPVVGDALVRVMLRAAGIPACRAVVADEASIVVPPLPGVGEISGDDAPDDGALPEGPGNSGAEDAAAFTRAYASGGATPDDVAARFLAALESSRRQTPPLGAFVFSDPADLRAQARESALRWREGKALGPLDGVPVAVKDELDQTPYRTTAGTRFLGKEPATADATVVARLRAAGALLVGKTAMQETGLGITGINPHPQHGTPRNPYDPARITGGSSSGSAAAVAAGLCPLAVGADAGGSVRIPAALCGIVGLKPTFGRMSEKGAVPIVWSIAHVGVFGATARDVALAYVAMAGRDPDDPNTLRQPRPTLRALTQRQDLSGLTVGVYRPWFEDAESDVVSVCNRAVARLADAGAVVREIDIPEVHLVRPVHLVTVAAEWMTAFGRHYERNRRAFGHNIRLTARLARSLRPTDYIHAQRLRRRISGHFAAALRGVDVIATPTTAMTAPVIPRASLRTGESDSVTLDRMTRFVMAANLTGLPAISFPAGYDGKGMPVGLQLIGRAWEEDVLLHFAACAQRLVERRRPGVWWGLLKSEI